MAIVILHASIRDLESVLYLEKVCFEEDAWTILDLTYALSAPNRIRFKALVDENFAGFAAAENHTKECISWITTIAVLPEYRNRGVASALLNACEADLSYPKVRLAVNVHNIAAIRLYRKYGYKEIETWKNYYMNGDNALIMEKQL